MFGGSGRGGWGGIGGFGVFGGFRGVSGGSRSFRPLYEPEVEGFEAALADYFEKPETLSFRYPKPETCTPGTSVVGKLIPKPAEEVLHCARRGLGFRV